MNPIALLAGAGAIALAAVAGLDAPAARAQPPGPPAMSTHDFITAAAQTDEFERREGRLAATHAQNPKVRAFGRMMVRDHTKTTAELKAAIRRAHMAVPPPPPLTGAQEGMYANLTGLHGKAFDDAYVMQQVQAHQMALAAMQGYAASGHDQPIREAAAKTVPIVQHHLMMAQDLANGR